MQCLQWSKNILCWKFSLSLKRVVSFALSFSLHSFFYLLISFFFLNYFRSSADEWPRFIFLRGIKLKERDSLTFIAVSPALYTKEVYTYVTQVHRQTPWARARAPTTRKESQEGFSLRIIFFSFFSILTRSRSLKGDVAIGGSHAIVWPPVSNTIRYKT